MGLQDRDYYREHHKAQQRAANPAPASWRELGVPQLSGWWIWVFRSR